MGVIENYFPELDAKRLAQLNNLRPLYIEWNARINVISRKDIDNIMLHHVLHSLAIAKAINFKPGTKILDVGTGGGFPGVPLAVFFPDCDFTLVDSIGKKIKVVNEVAKALKLENIKTMHERAENINDKFDFVISRAVTQFPEFYKWVQHKFSKKHINALPNGILYLKGGDLDDELSTFKKQIVTYNLTEYFKEDFFETKKIIYLPC